LIKEPRPFFVGIFSFALLTLPERNDQMKKLVLLLLITVLQSSLLNAQGSRFADSSFIITLNQQIDNYVVEHDVAALDKLYAADFVFSHGSGKVEGKQGWFKSVAKGSFISRQHDSVMVELHKELAIVRGNLSVQKKGTDKTERYHLKYIRVYTFLDKHWQMISHITTAEWHEPD
jgi:hypothetical protein